MIISILEHYESSEESINWFCDTTKATPTFQGSILKALAHPHKTIFLLYGTANGFQDQQNRQNAQVRPPVMVDDEIELWFE